MYKKPVVLRKREQRDRRARVGHPSVSNQQGMRQLAQYLGIEVEYQDGRQHQRQASDETLRAALQALEIDIDSDPQQELQRIQDEQWIQMMEPVLLYYPEDRSPISFQVALPIDEETLPTVLFHCLFTNEQGAIRRFRVPGASCSVLEVTNIQEQRYVRVKVSLSYRPRIGYYTLILRASIAKHVFVRQSLVIAAPRQCYLPISSRKVWGLGVQLYGVQSRDNWGVGDFRDLGRIVKTAGTTWKASTVGLQPLHSLTLGLSSPYSPSSRLFWNPLYLNLEEVAEFRTSPSVSRKSRSKQFQSMLQGLRDCRLVNYEEVSKIKWTILEELFRDFRRRHFKNLTNRGRKFCNFVEQHQPHLTTFCTFQALSECFQTMEWDQWPMAYGHPHSHEIETFQTKNASRIQFFQYVQWLCELQLTGLDRLARHASLSLGLYHDLPVGIHPNGADAWAFQDQLAKGITVGAPPDIINMRGQNWGLLSPNPRTMREQGYQFLRLTLRRNMCHGGVLRIDHALGLFRMFCIPQGETGQDGVYIRTYVDEVLAVLALESVRHQVIVVGEDLGTVTPAIRQKLEAAGLLSYRLLMFERDEEGSFHAPHAFPEQALVAATTHDLPTLTGYWVGRDIEVKKAAGLYPQQEDMEEDNKTREQTRRLLWKALQKEELAPMSPMPEALSSNELRGVYRYLARTPSKLLVVQLEDLLAEVDSPNLPGAPEQAYPSWRMRTSRKLEGWLKDPVLSRFAQEIYGERHRRRPKVRKPKKAIPQKNLNPGCS